MTLMPDPTTAYVDPFREHKTLALDFDVLDPLTGEAYCRDPRNIARKAEAHLGTTGIGDTAYFAPEAEFYIFDRVHYATSRASRTTRSSRPPARGTPARDSQDNRGYKVRYKGGYFPVTPTDHFADLRGDMMTNLERVGLTVERGHHEVGTAGQAEINYNFNSLRAAADDIMKFKYIIRNTAWATTRPSRSCPSRSSATTAPACTATSRSGTTASRCSTTRPVTADCPTPRAYVGGLLKHAPSLLAFTCPTVNSYHRLVPGFEAPVALVYSRATGRPACASRSPGRTRRPSASSSACPTRPATRTSPSRRCSWPASTASRNKIEPRRPRSTRTSTSSPPEEHAQYRPRARPPSTRCSTRSRPTTSSSLEGDVFTPDLIETWIDLKRDRTRSPPCSSARTRTSSSCTTTSEGTRLGLQGFCHHESPLVRK